jgi:hypothetical protein
MTNLDAAARNNAILREELLRAYPGLIEDDQALSDTLEGISDFSDAVAAVVRSMDDDEMMIVGIKDRQSDLTARQQRHEARIASKRAALTLAMERAGEKKITAPDFTLSLTAVAPKVIVTDEGALPKDYLVQPEPPPPRPDKKLIKQALADGFEVPGATLSNGSTTITIRKK